MATAKLTQTKVDRAKAGAKEILLWDTKSTGLGLRILPSGARSYIMKYRIGRGAGSEVRKVSFGSIDDLTLEAARERADEWRAKARRGIDPAREDEQRMRAPKMSDLAKEWLDMVGTDGPDFKRTWREDEHKLNKHILPALGKHRVADVTRADIRKLHRSMKATPYAANRVLALLSSLFNLAIGEGLRDDNPAKMAAKSKTDGIRRYQEDRRERFLSPEELGRLTEALAAYEDEKIADAIRLLVLTGARRGEVLSARWEQFDLEAGVWVKPSAHTKQKKTHRVPLSAPALDVLARRAEQKSGCGYVFPGRIYGKPMVDIKKAWAIIREDAGLGDVRLHDLRHSYASILVSGGASLEMVGALLGHTNPTTTKRYAHLADDPLRELTGKVGALMEGLENGGAANVTPLRRQGR